MNSRQQLSGFCPSALRSAFTLVELLIVMAVLGVLLALAAPAFISTTATQLSSLASQTGGVLSQAQQAAMLSGRSVEVRFYRCPPEMGVAEDPWAFRAIQAFREDEEGGWVALNRVSWITTPYVIVSHSRHTSLADLPVQFDPEFVRKEASYVSFRFLGDGSTSLEKSGAGRWFLTLAPETESDSAKLPKNFATLQIDPINGAIKTYRP